jgi:hypothetical protein
MSGSLLTGPPREADEGGKKEGRGGFYRPVSSIDNPVPKTGSVARNDRPLGR